MLYQYDYIHEINEKYQLHTHLVNIRNYIPAVCTLILELFNPQIPH
ncbi:MAG: hypothetical protein HeimC2_20460 [Candidatus Heimdallarchaeota archaeon LC_2]|nr:MAG: hypothetical protein HeimC2_20460 [Candidatus Heimdallarchaeota archaeon LC_2]